MTQYGPQGDPVTVKSEDTLPPPPPPPPGFQANADEPSRIDGTIEPTDFDIPAEPEPPTDAERAEHKSDLAAANHLRAEEAEVRLRTAGGLVTSWEDKAVTTALRSDYQRGQRDATLACVADLRKALGL